MIKKKFFVGKIKDYQKNKGWFFGHFMDKGLLKCDLVEVAFQDISGKKSKPSDKHFHKKSVEVNIVISGRVKFVIDGEKVEAGKGDFWVVYPCSVVESFQAGQNTKLVVIKTPSLDKDKFN